MDKIHINGISCSARLGVSEDERRTAQDLLIDLTLHADLDAPARDDALEGAIDYVETVATVNRVAQEREFRLLEALARAVCNAVLEESGAGTVEITVRKFPELLREQVTYVAVEMKRDNPRE